MRQLLNTEAIMEYLQPNELLRVLAEAKRNSARNHCMFLLGFMHGLRTSEIAQLTLDDVRNGEIDICRLKDSLHTVQPLQSHTNPLLDEPAVLKAWLDERGDGDGSTFLFTSRQGSALSRRQIHSIFEDICVRAGLGGEADRKRRHPHILKHSLASSLIRNGVSLAHVQQALGHKHISSTVRYTHISQAEASEKVSGVMGAVFA
jgi:type 1 fimbriae regulatory protein FimB